MNKSEEFLFKFHKKNMLPVYSGTLAIEGILKILNLKSNSKVLITNVVCYSILEAILNADLVPVIAIPKNNLTLSKDEIKKIVKEEKIKVFIAVHQYGYEQEIIKIKDLIIIEDISQAWNIELANGYVGKNSDYVVTSLGKTKPLSNGIGGLIFSNEDFMPRFDIKIRQCRNRNFQLLEYFYPLYINYKKLVKKANKKVEKQRKNAKILKEIFNNYTFIDMVDIKKSNPSYHRFLISVDDNNYYMITKLLNECKIMYQKEYRNKLDTINIVKKYNIKVVGESNKKNFLLLKTDNNYFCLKKLERKLKKVYGS